MRRISQRELRNGSAAVMDGVQAGETYTITGNGVPVAELRPLGDGRTTTTRDLIDHVRTLPAADYAQLRREADVALGDSDGEWGDPYERRHG